MKPANFCPIERPLSSPLNPNSITAQKPKETPMLQIPVYQKQLLQSVTKKEQVNTIWQFAVEMGILANLDDKDKSRMKEIIEKFNQ